LEDALAEAATLREQLAASEEVRTKALDQAKVSDSLRARVLEESEHRAASRFLELERELDDKTRDFEE
jgi:hypothetical protein